jgi:hypothetical protein
LVAIEVDNVKVAHAIVVILRWLDHVCSTPSKFGVDTINVVDENADAAVTRQSMGLVRGQQMQRNLIAAQARIGYRGAILKSDREAKRVAVMLDTPGDVADDEYGRGTYYLRMFFSHPTLP